MKDDRRLLQMDLRGKRRKREAKAMKFRLAVTKGPLVVPVNKQERHVLGLLPGIGIGEKTACPEAHLFPCRG